MIPHSTMDLDIIGPGNSLLPDGTEILLVPMLIYQ